MIAASYAHVICMLAGGTETDVTKWQGLTLVHVGAQLEQLQDTFMSYVGFYGARKSSS
jgi:hypothetical protein